MNFGVHPGSINDGAVPVRRVGWLELHFLEGERGADDVAADAFEVFAFVAQERAVGRSHRIR